MKVLDLFAGIGGFTLGLKSAGMETVAFCEFDKHAQKVLNKHWPDVPIYDDVRELTNERLKADGITGIDVITGGFPCQDISVAGKQKGLTEETRSGLWSECARLLGEIRPRYAIFENVTALLNGQGGDWFKRVLFDISQVGYDAEWHCISASELGAHHHRDRIWIIAYPKSERINREHGNNRSKKEKNGVCTDKLNGCGVNAAKAIHANASKQRCDNGANNRKERHFQNDKERQPSEIQQQGNKRESRPSEACEILSDTSSKRQQGQGKYEQPLFTKAYGEGQAINAFPGGSPDIWKVESKLGRVADGVPNRSHRLKQLGNAVVPQIPELIGRAIMEVENDNPLP